MDSPATTLLRRRIIRENRFLRRLYREWTSMISAFLPLDPWPALELGSGGGFTKEALPGLIASDVFHLPGMDLVARGENLPFRGASLGAILMTNVFHHLPDAEAFLREAARAIKPGGRLILIEPWITPWSRMVYRFLHHEPVSTTEKDWRLPSGGGPLSSANSAQAWIVFRRDMGRFTAEFPQWRPLAIRPMMPFCYIISGGVSMRPLAPKWLYRPWRAAEELLPQGLFAMFALIALERTDKNT